MLRFFAAISRILKTRLSLRDAALPGVRRMMGDDDDGGGDWGGSEDAEESEEDDESADAADKEDEDEDEDDKPKKKKKKNKQSQGFAGWMIGAAIGGVLLLSCCCCGGGVGVFMLIPSKAGLGQPLLQVDPLAGPPIASQAKGTVILNQKSLLTRLDAGDPVAGRRTRMKSYKVALQANTGYVISMNSRDFDSFLRLEDPAGKQVAEDDDSGGDLNSRIFYTPTQSGTFRVIATTFIEGETGSFQLTVQEQNPGKKDNPK
jgi:hypothetical protein